MQRIQVPAQIPPHLSKHALNERKVRQDWVFFLASICRGCFRSVHIYRYITESSLYLVCLHVTFFIYINRKNMLHFFTALGLKCWTSSHLSHSCPDQRVRQRTHPS